jgi:DNA-binding transcriptional ArsR family regulator
MRKPQEMRAELRKSETKRAILLQLRNNPISASDLFNELCKAGKVKSKSTLHNHLKECYAEGLVTHESRNSPYKITQKGIDWLRLSEPKITENYLFEYVRSGDFAGSIILHIPQKDVQKFNTLFNLGPLESLGRILQLSLHFWFMKHGCEPPMSAYGVKIGENAACGIGDLTMFETPKTGYENIRDLAKKGTGKPIVWLAYDALENQLAREKNDSLESEVFRLLADSNGREMLKATADIYGNWSIGKIPSGAVNIMLKVSKMLADPNCEQTFSRIGQQLPKEFFASLKKYVEQNLAIVFSSMITWLCRSRVVFRSYIVHFNPRLTTASESRFLVCFLFSVNP